MIIAIIAQTQQRAWELADDLGIQSVFVFAYGADDQQHFEGLRVNRSLIDANAELSAEFVHTIYATTLKTPGGKVRYVAVADERHAEFSTDACQPGPDGAEFVSRYTCVHSQVSDNNPPQGR